MNVLEQLMHSKGWSYYQLSIEYGKLEHPELAPAELVKKYSTNVRRAVRNPENARFDTVKKLALVLGAELVIKVKQSI